MITELNRSYPTARKEHKCMYCGGCINVGDKYERQTLIYDNQIYDWVCHLECQEVTGLLNMFDNDMGEGVEQMIEEGMKVDLIVTDPPYLFESEGKGKSKLGQRADKLKESIDFISKDFDFEKCFEMFLQLQDIPNMLIFCSNRQLSRTMQFFENKGLSVTCLVWHKMNPIPLTNNTYMQDIEFVIRVNGKGATFNNDCPFDYKRKVYTSGIIPAHNRLHPTQKDLKHISRFIELHSNEGDLILDAFMGSGTTAIACIKNKRNFIGFELSDEFYKVATKRVENEQANLTLF